MFNYFVIKNFVLKSIVFNQSIRFIFHSMYNNDKDDAMLGTDGETSRGRTALSFRVPEKVLSAII